MELPKKIIRWETKTGDRLTIGALTVTPQSQALILRWPNGGWVWNRPVAVLVEQGRQVKRIPLVDVTRLAQLGLLGLSLVFMIGIFILSSRHKEKSK